MSQVIKVGDLQLGDHVRDFGVLIEELRPSQKRPNCTIVIVDHGVFDVWPNHALVIVENDARRTSEDAPAPETRPH